MVVFATLAVMFLPNFALKTKKIINSAQENNTEKIEFASNNGLLAVFSNLEGYKFSSTTDQLLLSKGDSKVLFRWVNRQQADEFAKQDMVYSRQQENGGLVRNDYELVNPIDGELNLATVVWSGDQALLVAYNREILMEAERLLSTIQITTMSTSVAVVSTSTATTTSQIKLVKPTLVKSDGYVVSLFFPKKDSNDCQQLNSISIKIKDVETELGLIPSVVKIIMQYPVVELEKLGLKPLFSENIRLLSFGYNNNTAVLNFNELLRANSVCSTAVVKSSLLQTLSSLRSSSSLQIKSVDIQIDGQKLK